METMKNQLEEWRPTEGFPLYDVSNLGRVRSWRVTGPVPKEGLARRTVPKILKPTVKYGYPRVNLMSSEGRKVARPIHRLLALAFIGPPPPDKPLVRHLNGDPMDCRLENLAWGSYADNARDRERHCGPRELSTHCPRGHELVGYNLILKDNGFPSGDRVCRTCHNRNARESRRRRRKERKAAAAAKD